MPDPPTFAESVFGAAMVERPYKGAASFYARYRAPYPAGLAPLLRDAFHLDGSRRLLDLGCGPGPVAIRLAPLFEQVVAMDPEPDMLDEGARQAAIAGVENIEWVRGSSEDLAASLGTFRLVTMGESFHWMNRRHVLEELYDLVEVNGGVAIMGRGNPLPLPPITPWRAAVVDVLHRYLGDVTLPWDREPIPPGERHQAVLADSPFVDVTSHSELFDHDWTVEAMLGNLYSMSFCNRVRLGERAEAFERDVRAAAFAVEPSGVLRGELHEFFAILAFKRAPQAA